MKRLLLLASLGLLLSPMCACAQNVGLIGTNVPAPVPVAPTNPSLSCPTSSGVSPSYSSALVASLGTAPYVSYAITSGALPTGLTLNTSTGAIVGNPFVLGAFSFTGRVTDNTGRTGSASCTITIASNVSLTIFCPSPTGVNGVSYGSGFAASGGSGVFSSYAITAGTLPTGLSLNTTTGAITGTPSAVGDFHITGQVTDSLAATAVTGNCGITIGAAGGFVPNHPRLDLTTSRLAALVAKKNANTTSYQNLKAYADGSIPFYLGGSSTLTSSLSTGTSGTFTVASGSSFPAGAFHVAIGVEELSISGRSGNTLTYDARALTPYGATAPTTAASHASGSLVIEFKEIGSSGGAVVAGIAAMDAIGVGGYSSSAANMIAYTMTFMAASRPNEYDRCRSEYIWTVRGFDWAYSRVGSIEKATYGALLRTQIQGFLDYRFGYDPSFPQRVNETAFTGNEASGGLQFELAAAAASYGDNPDAVTQYTSALGDVGNFLIPAMQDGPISGGVQVEGAEYGQETWHQGLEIFEIINSATGTDLWSSVDTWLTGLSKYFFHQNPPGSNGSISTQAASIAAGSRTLTLSGSIGDFAKGQRVFLLLDNFTNYESTIQDVSGLVLTMSDAPLTDGITGRQLQHVATVLPYGDIQDSYNQGYLFAHWREGQKMAAFHLLDRLKTQNPTYAGYVRWFIDHYAERPTTDDTKLLQFMYDDPTVTGVDYTAVLPTNYVTPSVNSTGMLLNRSAWTDAATWSFFLVAGRNFGSHVHSHVNSYGLLRDGTYLTREVALYAGGPEVLGYGGRYHNTVLMNDHSSDNSYFGIDDTTTDRPGPASLTRSDPTSTYAYARGDGSLAYTSPNWTGLGYPNNCAQTFMRDFAHINPDTVIFHDWMGYSCASLSPTTWIAQFVVNPTIAGQRISETVGTQKLVHDVVLPAGATLTKVDQVTENIGGSATASVTIGSTTMTVGGGSDFLPGEAVIYADDAGTYHTTGLTWVFDLAVDAVTNTKVTSAFYAFTGADVGRKVLVYPSGTWITGEYTILSVASGAATLDSSPAPVGTTAGIFFTEEGTKLVLTDAAPATATAKTIYHNTGYTGYRVETRSGATTSKECSLQVLQVMDSGSTPATVTNLGATNADVVEVGTASVAGFVCAASPTLPITYTISGSPTFHKVFGMALSTAYHVTDVAGAVTIAAATGSGDTTSSSAGELTIP